MDPALKEALEALHDFRQFVNDNARVWEPGSSHVNPMWVRVATVLDKHDMNCGPDILGAYYQPDPAYRPNTR